MHISPARSVICLIIVLLPALLTTNAIGDNTKQQPVVLSLPAETVLTSIQKLLPLEIPSQSRQLQGDITVESVERLVIHDNIITVHGVLFGRNLVATTNFGGQDIQLRLGEVRLPMICDLQTRFDAVRKKLLLTPHFRQTAHIADESQDPLTPLINALSAREYVVDLDALEAIDLKVGAQSILLVMEPINISTLNDTLVFHLLPRVSKAQ